MSQDILLTLIEPDPGQPRRFFDPVALAELAESIAANGQAVPILLRPGADGRYIIVHGERRFRAVQSLGWVGIRAEVRDMTPGEARWLALAENIQRADLSPIEEAEAYRAALADGITQTELGRRLGKTQSYIAQKLRLLKAPAAVRALLSGGALTEAHVRQLLRIEAIYPPDKRREVVTAPLSDGPYTRDTCYLVGAYNVLRPEDNPQVPLWVFPDELVRNCSHLPALYDSLEALANDAWAEPDHKAPCWVAAAFWFGAAAVVFNLPVADLAELMNGWRERLYSSIWYLITGPSEAGPRRENKAFWWGCHSDLRHAGLLPVTDADLAHTWDRGFAFGEFWTFPSSLQSWGINHAVGESIAEADARRNDGTSH